MIRKMVFVVTAGGFDPYEGIIRTAGYEVMAIPLRTFEDQIGMCVAEFKNGIPLAIVHGVSTSRLLDAQQRPYGLSDAELITERLKQECDGIKVIVMCTTIGEPVREMDRLYDVLIPYGRNDLRNMIETFLGFAEW